MEPDGSPYVPGAFVWIMHERLGGQTGATPDGRKRGKAFADGAGPAQGRETKGPTAAIMSTTSWQHWPLIGGIAFNMKFNSTVVRSEIGVRRLRDLIVEYLRRGGFETQINVVDRATLLAAQANPGDYADLIVRVAGFSAYFTQLAPATQNEIISRTEHVA